MSWIRPIEMNMDISRTVLEGKWDNCLLDTIQKIAIYAIIPFMMIAAFEAVIKNLICISALNVGIALLNQSHALYKRFFV